MHFSDISKLALLAAVAQASPLINREAGAISCPANDGAPFTSGGKQFTVACGKDYQAGQVDQKETPNFEACVAACADNTACKAVAFVPFWNQDAGFCYLKSNAETSNDNSGVWGAAIITTTTPPVVPVSEYACPANNGKEFNANGKKLTIACGKDQQGSQIDQLESETFDACLTACTANSQCKGVSFSPKGGNSAGGWCYLKSTFASPVDSPSSWGAILYEAPEVTGTCPSGVTDQTYYTVLGQSFKYECSTDRSSGSLMWSLYAGSANACAALCRVNKAFGCVEATWSKSASNCKLYKSYGTGKKDITRVNLFDVTPASSAPTQCKYVHTKAFTATCPEAAGVCYLSAGKYFSVECGKDAYGQDVGLEWDLSYGECLNKCTTTTGCKTVSYNPGNKACYLKNSNSQDVRADANIWGARIINSNVQQQLL